MTTVNASLFARTLDEVHRHAAVEKHGLPEISCVRFEIFDDRIVLVATDRHTLLAGVVGKTTDPAAGDPVDTFQLPIASAKDLMKYLRARKLTRKDQDGKCDLALELSNGIITVSLNSGVFAEYPGSPHNFPQWRAHLRSPGPGEHPTCLDSHLLGGRKDLMVIPGTGNKRSILASRKESDLSLVGVIMPVVPVHHPDVGGLIGAVG